MPGHQRPDHHVEPRDVRRREREHPRPGPAEAGGGRGRRGEHRVPRQDDLLGRTRRARGGDDGRLRDRRRRATPRRRRRRARRRRSAAGGHATNATGGRCTPRVPPLRATARIRGATAADWVAGARPRTLPAAISPVLAGTGVAVYVDERGLVEGAARPGGQPRPPGRRQLRQRLLRRHPRHRRRPGRPDAARRLRHGDARGGEARGVPGVRGRGCRRARAGRDDRLVAGAVGARLRRWPPGSTPAGPSPTATSGSAR